MEKAKLKKLLKTTTLSLFACFVGVLVAWMDISTTSGTEVATMSVKWMFFSIIGFILFIDFCAIMIYYGNALINKKEIIENNNYERDLPKDIPPAIASMLLDYIIDNERDYTATVASLIAKGYLTVNNNEAFRVFRWDKENLLEHERIVFEALTKEEIYDEEKFKNAVRNDALNLGVVQKVNKNYTYLIPVIALIAILWYLRPDAMKTFNPIVYMIFLMFLLFFTIFIIIMSVFSSKNHPSTEKGNFNRTEFGIEKAKKITGLKNFLHDYTMLKEKGLTDIILYDDYIAYAIALGEADAIEDLILNDSKYRSLVYRKYKESDNPIQRFY